MKQEPSFRPLALIGMIAAVGVIFVAWGVFSLRNAERQEVPQITAITPSPELSLVLTPSPTPNQSAEGQISIATAANVQELARYDGLQFMALDWMPDGQTVVVATSAGVNLYDATTLEIVQRWPTSHQVRNLAVSPDGRLVAGAIEERLVVWQSADGAVVAELDDLALGGAVAFSPDGQWLFGAGAGALWQWSVPTWEEPLMLSLPSQGIPTDLAVSQDGTLLAVSMPSCETYLVDMGQMSVRPPLGTSCSPSITETRAIFSTDAALLVTANAWQPVTVWDVREAREVRTLATEPPSMPALALEGSLLVTTSQADQAEIQVWDAATGVLSQTLSARGGVVLDVGLAPQGNFVALISSNNALIRWDLAKPDEPQVVDGGLSRVFPMAISDDGRVVAALSDQNTPWPDDDRLLVWNEQAAESDLYQLDGTAGTVMLGGVSIPPDTDTALERNWSLKGGALLRAARSTTDDPWRWNAAFDAFRTLEPRIKQTQVELVDRRTSETTRLEIGREIRSITVSDDGQLVAISDASSNVSVWSIPEQRELKRFAASPAAAAALRFSADSRRLLGVSYDFPQTLFAWDVETGALIFMDASSEIYTTNPGVLSRDNSLIVLLNLDDIELRQATNGAVLKTLVSQPTGVMWIELSSDGTRLVAGHMDGTLVIWGLP